MKCIDPLHASLTDNLSDPNQTSKMLVQTVRQTNGIGWFFKTRLASVLKKLIHHKKVKSVGGIRLAPVKTEKSQFSIQALLLNGCNLLSLLIDKIIATNLFNGRNSLYKFGNRHYEDHNIFL